MTDQEQFNEHDHIHFAAKNPAIHKLAESHGGKVVKGSRLHEEGFSLPKSKTAAFHAAASKAGFHANKHYRFRGGSSHPHHPPEVQFSEQDDLAEYDSTKDPFAYVPATIAVAGPVIYPPIAMRAVEEDTEQFEEKLTPEQHYHGLIHWVDTYKGQRHYGNVHGAKQTYKNIMAKVKKHKLDKTRVFGNDPDHEKWIKENVSQHDEDSEEDAEQFDENSETHRAFKKAYPHTTHAHGRYSGDDHEHFHALVMKHGGDVFDNNRFAIPHDKLKTFHAFAVSHKYKMNRQSSQHSEEEDDWEVDDSTDENSQHSEPPITKLGGFFPRHRTLGTAIRDSAQFKKGQRIYLHHTTQKGRWTTSSPHSDEGAYIPHSDYKEGKWRRKQKPSQHSEEDGEQFAENDPLSDVLNTHGYKIDTSARLRKGYRRFTKNSHTVDIHSGGNWNHMERSVGEKKGSGPNSLASHLASVHRQQRKG